VAGTMPHAIFIETDVDGAGGAAAYAAELPGCAVFSDAPDDAAEAMPRRAEAFCRWLREAGEEAPGFLGDNWYEVERAAAAIEGARVLDRAAFSLDELPPSDEEFAAWLRWLELAREELATAVDAAGEDAAAAGPHADLLARLAAQDLRLASALGDAGDAVASADDPVDALYAARDRLTVALQAAGAGHEGVRRAVRLAIADDLRAAELLSAAKP
jgi:hypothetical protein